MPRRRSVQPRKVIPDPKFGSDVVTKFVNTVMRSGKKSIAEKIVYSGIDFLEKHSTNIKFAEPEKEKGDFGRRRGPEAEDTSGNDALAISQQSSRGLTTFITAIRNVSPVVEVRSRRVGGATYQVPVEVQPRRRLALGMRWIIDSAKKRNEKTMALRLGAELLDAAQGRGEAMKMRANVHRMAEANKAFAHYRW